MLINRKIFILIAVTTILGGIYGGQEELKGASSGSSDSNNPPNITLSDLLASVNMYHIRESQTPPDFTLLSLDGEEINLGSNRGKVVLLSFWATW